MLTRRDFRSSVSRCGTHLALPTWEILPQDLFDWIVGNNYVTWQLSIYQSNPVLHSSIHIVLRHMGRYVAVTSRPVLASPSRSSLSSWPLPIVGRPRMMARIIAELAGFSYRRFGKLEMKVIIAILSYWEKLCLTTNTSTSVLKKWLRRLSEGCNFYLLQSYLNKIISTE